LNYNELNGEGEIRNFQTLPPNYYKIIFNSAQKNSMKVNVDGHSSGNI